MDLINNLFSDQLMHAVGWTIVHSIWQASFVALIMSVFLNKYQKEKSVVRYRIAITSLYVILALSVATFFVHYLSPGNAGAYTLTATSTLHISNMAGSNFIQQITFGLVNHFDLITSIWITGMVVFLFKFIGGYLLLKRYELSGDVIPDSKVHVIFNDLMEKMNLDKPVELLESALVQTPMMIGHLKPIILLPLGIVNHLELNEVEAILAHELSHISRNDFLQNLLQSIIEIVFYYHPAVWWVSANIRAERENCCDEEAVRLCGSAVNYAKALVKIEELQSQNIPALAIPMARNKHSLLNRVSRILNQPQNKSQIREKLVATLLLFSAFTLFGESSPSNFDIGFQLNGYSVTVEENENCDLQLMADNPNLIKKLIISTDNSRMVVDTIPQKDCKCNDVSVETTEKEKSFSLQIKDGVVEELIIDGEKVEDVSAYIKSGKKGNIIWTDDGKLLLKEIDADKKYKDYNLEDIQENEILKAPFKISGPKDIDQQIEMLTEKLNSKMLQKGHLSKEFLAQLLKKNSKLFHSYDNNITSDELRELLAPLSSDVFKSNPFLVMPEIPVPSTPPTLHLENNIPKWKFEHSDQFDKVFERNTPKGKIFGTLLNDRLIESDEENSIELTDKYLKINGEKMPSNIWKKYKKIYESQLGHELIEGSKIKLKERTISKSGFFIG